MDRLSVICENAHEIEVWYFVGLSIYFLFERNNIHKLSKFN